MLCPPPVIRREEGIAMGSWKALGRILALLLVAALLEVGGDAGMRAGLQGKRVGFVAGIVMLVSYGLIVNLANLDFGRLMGIYISLFFVASQILAVLVFKEKLQPSVWVGGALIVAGGCVLTFWQKR